MNKIEYDDIVERIGIIRKRSYDSSMADNRDRVKTLTTNLYETLDIIQLLLNDALDKPIISYSNRVPNTFSIPEVRKPYRTTRPTNNDQEDNDGK